MFIKAEDGMYYNSDYFTKITKEVIGKKWVIKAYLAKDGMTGQKTNVALMEEKADEDGWDRLDFIVKSIAIGKPFYAGQSLK